MAKGQCTATILQGGTGDARVGATTHRCNKDAGHEKDKDQSVAIHDSNGVTWYDGDLDQFESEN